mmetsp:Transcript_38883/g.79509  ORF Transcript_38883/g.79509 Transcript_38883/m.79509 type:complete len:182 (-) Transcript_38883:149-694(-)
MDGWSHTQILSMLEGGNDQLSGFFIRHSLSPRAADGGVSGEALAAAEAAAATAAAIAANHQTKRPNSTIRSNSCGNAVDEIVARRYKTKAALFYRQNLAKHVVAVAADGEYKGREAARKRSSKKSQDSSKSKPPPSPPKDERKSKALKSAGEGELPPISGTAVAAAAAEAAADTSATPKSE